MGKARCAGPCFRVFYGAALTASNAEEGARGELFAARGNIFAHDDADQYGAEKGDEGTDDVHRRTSFG